MQVPCSPLKWLCSLLNSVRITQTWSPLPLSFNLLAVWLSENQVTFLSLSVSASQSHREDEMLWWMEVCGRQNTGNQISMSWSTEPLNVTRHGKGEFAGVITLRILRWGDYSRLSRWARGRHQGLIRGGGAADWRGGKWGDSRSRHWSDVATSQGMPAALEPGRGNERFSPSISGRSKWGPLTPS